MFAKPVPDRLLRFSETSDAWLDECLRSATGIWLFRSQYLKAQAEIGKEIARRKVRQIERKYHFSYRS